MAFLENLMKEDKDFNWGKFTFGIAMIAVTVVAVGVVVFLFAQVAAIG